MEKRDIVQDIKSQFGGAGMLNLSEIAKYLGRSRNRVKPLLEGLEYWQMGTEKKYLVVDIAKKLRMRVRQWVEYYIPEGEAMKKKEIKKTVEQLAAEYVAEKNIRLFKNDRGGVGIEFDYYGGREKVESITYVEVQVYRSQIDQKISYPIWVDATRESGGSKIFGAVNNVEEAFAVYDILDAAISRFAAENEIDPRHAPLTDQAKNRNRWR